MRKIAIALIALLLAAPAFAQDISNPQTDASKLTTGTLAGARCCSGTITGPTISAPVITGAQTNNSTISFNGKVNISGVVGMSNGTGNVLLLRADTAGVQFNGSSDTIIATLSGTGVLGIPNTATDAAQTDNTLCLKSDGTVLKGSGTIGVCLGTSSARYKERIVSMLGGLSEVMRLDPKNFFYRHGHGDDGAREQYGFIAEDVVGVLPKLVGLDDEGRPNSVDMVGMIPLLVRSVHELKADNDNLRARLDALDHRRNASFEGR